MVMTINDPGAEYRAFVAGFSRSAKGNLCRDLDGTIVTVFRRRNGSYRWCIAYPQGPPQFATSTYATEEGAMEGLHTALMYPFPPECEG